MTMNMKPTLMIRNMRSSQNINICCGSAEPVPLTPIYDENDFDKLIQSDKMFVRKLTSNKSLQLIEMMDRYRQE